VVSPHAERYRLFLERLVAARKAAGLTQRDVSAAIGMPQPLVCKCETGERRVDVVEFEQFAELYKRPLRFFLPKARRRR
jgi:transcriptional regulator with XRE-family HTH domain